MDSLNTTCFQSDIVVTAPRVILSSHCTSCMTLRFNHTKMQAFCRGVRLAGHSRPTGGKPLSSSRRISGTAILYKYVATNFFWYSRSSCAQCFSSIAWYCQLMACINFSGLQSCAKISSSSSTVAVALTNCSFGA